MFKLQNERSVYVNPVATCLMATWALNSRESKHRKSMYIHKYSSTVRELFIISLKFLLYILHRLFWLYVGFCLKIQDQVRFENSTNTALVCRPKK